MNLEELRRRIDELDDAILGLLERRANVALDIAKAKAAAGVTRFHDPEREREVLDRLEARGAGRFPRAAIRAVFREIMSACLSLEQPLRVAFLGPAGTFSHIAARRAFGGAAVYEPADSLDDAFESVRRGECAYGVVPIESLAEGSVDSTLDALWRGDLRIRMELVQEISHCLLTLAPSLERIERVYSHPQALAQCRSFLARHLPSAQMIPTPSTARAAQEALADPAGAAIASKLAGELYGIPALRESIQDRQPNVTRFVVVAKSDAPRTGDDKTSLAFSTKNEVGALRRILSIFEDAGIDLSRIESRPHPEKPWEYVFFVDAHGHRLDPHFVTAIEKLEAHCSTLRIFGSYPRAKAH